MMKIDDEMAEKLVPMLKVAIAGRLVARSGIAAMATCIADTMNESELMHAERVIDDFVEDYVLDNGTADGLGIEDVKGLFEDLAQQDRS